MLKTKNDIPEQTRAKVVDLLNARLSDSIDLGRQTKQAHWNVRGPHFIALHQLFDQVYDQVEDFTDLIAERIAQFGGTAEGTLQAAARHSTLSPYPPGIVEGKEHVEALAAALSSYGKNIRQAIDQADELHDKGTADIFTEISRGIDKALWMVEAHHQAK
jgi:starvation-inducible DNA-binding protein